VRAGPEREDASRRPSTEQLRARLWFWPLVASVGAFVLTLPLLTVRPRPDSALAEWTFPGDASTAASLLQTIATSVITAASLTFSLTVVALQLASQQFSPRLLRSFSRDALVQVTIAVLVSTFTVSVLTLRSIDPERPLPVLAVLLATVLGLASAAALVVFVGHIVTRLRVDNMMANVHGDTRSSLEESYPLYDEGPPPPGADLPGPDGGALAPAWRSGFVRSVQPAPLTAAAERADVVVLLGVRPGDTVVEGTPIASVLTRDGRPGDVPAVEAGLRDAVALGFERTEEQDAAFGLRQLVDMAVKAISPAVNDPTTAAEALSYCGDLLVRLQARRLGPQAHADSKGVVRLVTPDRDLRYYLDLVCAQVRRFGRGEPTVLTAVLRVLRDCAACARDDEQRAEVRRQCALVLEDMSPDLLEDDADAVRDMARRVELALAGDVGGAYGDRAGETRSI